MSWRIASCFSSFLELNEDRSYDVVRDAYDARFLFHASRFTLYASRSSFHVPGFYANANAYSFDAV
jgi:hypothetical protein